jgi:glyoxylase-like metal-dependent hydrolase (beta-lactamase superfamily II)
MTIQVKDIFDKKTNTLTYIVFDSSSKDAIIIDPVLDYDQSSSKFSYESIELIEKFIAENTLSLKYIFETHAHADHISGAYELRRRYSNIKIGVSEKISVVQDTFSSFFHSSVEADVFDHFIKDGEAIDIGSFKVEAIHTPGHTPACVSYKIEDKVFTGDALFMPDFGTGRCDFPKGSSNELYNSIHSKLYSLDDNTEVYVGHDYMPNERELKFKTTIGESKRDNIHLKIETTEEEFIKFRTNRDSELSAPKLLLPSIQLNINAGKFPKAESNGKSYLKLPINTGE